MRYRSFLVVLVLALTDFIALLAPPSARACSCEAIQPDIAYREAVTIFTGSVQKVTELTAEPSPPTEEPSPKANPGDDKNLARISTGRVTRFFVEEYFKGGGGSEIELHGENTSCDISFQTGKRYLVYATQNQQTGALGAYSCSRTTILGDHAKPDLSYLRHAAAGERPTMLYGFAFKNTSETLADPLRHGEPPPFGDLQVTVEGEGKRLKLTTDQTGYFEAYDLPAGTYRIRTAVTGKLRGAEEKTVELNSGGVASVTFWTTTAGSLSGHLLDQEGRAVREIQVNLLAAGAVPGARPVNYVETDEDGNFTFKEVAAGRYIIAVNPNGVRSLWGSPFLPSYFQNAAAIGDARIITVTDGNSLDLGDFVLQGRYPTVPVTGVVVSSDGKALAGAYVYLEKSGRGWDSAHSVQTDASGQFVIQAFEGLTYTLRAIGDGPTGAAVESTRVEITAAKGSAPVRLIVNPK